MAFLPASAHKARPLCKAGAGRPPLHHHLYERHLGEAQAGRYLDGIEDCCERLAERPKPGRTFKLSSQTMRRMEQGSHVIFYREQEDGILISRILHKSMLPSHHSFED